MSRYTAFTDNSVFKNHAINIVGNLFYDSVIAEYPAKDFTSLMAVTGKTSRVAQGEATGEVPNLAFITSDADYFSFLSENVKSIFNPDKVVRFKNTLQFSKYNFNFELHKSATALTIVTQDGLYLQNTSEIPSVIL